MATSASDRRLLVTVLLLLVVLLFVTTLFTGFGMMGFGPMMGGGMWGGGMWGDGTVPGWVPLFGAVMQLLFLLVVVGLGYLGYRAVVGRGDGADVALRELRLAYARGDLTDEEYERRRERLERDG